MSIMQAVEDKAKEFLVSRSLPKVAAVIGQAAAAAVVMHSPELQHVVGAVGISLNLDPDAVQKAVQLLVLGGFHMAGHFLAAKFPAAFGWLGAATAEADPAPAAGQ